MDLIPNDDQQQIIDMAADFIINELPLTRLFDARYDAGTARAQRQAMAGLGWFGIALGEDSGGVGMTVVEEAFILREIGRVVGPTAIIPAILAAKLADGAGQSDLRDAILAGTKGAAFAVAEAPLRCDADGVCGMARIYDVQDAGAVLAIVGEEALLLGIADGDLAEVPFLDSLTPVARRDLAGLPVLARAPAGATVHNGLLLAAAYLTGLAEGAVAMVQEYASIRETFGRKIGAYQAVRHPIAEGAARSDHARSLLYVAALALRDGRDDVVAQVSSAKVVAHRAATKNADINIQLHGGIGITSDLPAHHFMKRALMLAPWFGGRKALLDTLLDEPLLTI